MSRAQNRHDTLKWKRRRKTHLASKCKVAKCPVCHPNKYVGGNHAGTVKKKYLPAKESE